MEQILYQENPISETGGGLYQKLCRFSKLFLMQKYHTLDKSTDAMHVHMFMKLTSLSQTKDQ